MAAAPGSTAAAEEAAAAQAAVQDSDEEEEEGAVGAAAKPAPQPAAPTAAVDAAKGPTLSPRLRTRLFAAQLLHRLPPLVCAADARHTDLAAAQAAAKAGQGGDWLVLRLQQLVDLAFRMASGQLEVGRGCLVCGWAWSDACIASMPVACNFRGYWWAVVPAARLATSSTFWSPVPLAAGAAPTRRAPHARRAGLLWRRARLDGGGGAPDGAVPGTHCVGAAVSGMVPASSIYVIVSLMYRIAKLCHFVCTFLILA